MSKASPIPDDPGSLTGHARIDARSLALSALVARRLRERPELLEVGRRNLVRWRGRCAPNVQATLGEWQTILDAGLDAVVEVLTGNDEQHVRLRQSSPFAGEEIVTRRERTALWLVYSPRQAASSTV